MEVAHVNIAPDTPFTVETMRGDDYDRCIEMAMSAFNTNNPILRHAALSVDAYRRYAHVSCDRAKTVLTQASHSSHEEAAETVQMASYSAFYS